MQIENETRLKNLLEQYEEMTKLNQRYRKYYHLLNRWLNLKQNSHRLSDFLLNKHYQNIAIYGCGEMGKNLVEELHSSPITVSCFVVWDDGSELPERYVQGVSVYNLNNSDLQQIPPVDAIIVTPIYDFENIKKMLLENSVFCNLVSLEEIVNELYNEQIGIVHTDKHEWKRNAQEGEFEFHKDNLWRQSDDFMKQSKQLFEHFDLSQEKYKSKTIIDLGAGSKLRTKYYSGSTIIAIEPLADRFLNEISWCDLNEAAEVYALAAEEKIDRCVGRADLLISINVLDHCYDFEKVIENIDAYLKADGMAFLSFDKHLAADEMHPLQLTETICERIFKSQGLKIHKMSRGFANIFNGKQSYGHGPYALNYWLTKR